MVSQAARNNANRYNFLGKETQVGTGYMDLARRFYDPTIGRFMQVDPVTDTQEQYSTYQYGWNNPVLRSDPNGDCPDCPEGDPFLYARLIYTAFKDTEHAIINTTARYFGSDIRAGYKVNESGNQTFDTQIYRQPVDNSLGGAAKEALNTVADVAIVATAGSAPTNPGNLLAKTSAESQVVKAGKEVASDLVKTVNANSKASDKINTLYRLETKTGEYLKTGITSQAIPEKRYTNWFMSDKNMIPLDQGSRTNMLNKERKIVETDPGPLNREPWAGQKRKAND